MRPAREITAEEENFRTEAFLESRTIEVVRRDPVEPEPVGTIVLMAFRIVGYEADLDGSLMGCLEQIDKDGETTGWTPDCIGISPDCELVVTLEEFQAMFEQGGDGK